MLKCFSFRYETLQEDDYAQLNLSSVPGEQNSSEVNDSVVSRNQLNSRTNCADNNEGKSKTKKNTSHSTVEPSSAALIISNSKTKHSWKQDKPPSSLLISKANATGVLRLPSDSDERYTRLPPVKGRTRLPTSSSAPLLLPKKSPSSSPVRSRLEVVPPPPSSCRSVQSPVLPSSLLRSRMPRSQAEPSSGGAGASASGSSNGIGGSDWTRSGSFFNKPSRGWIHPNQQLTEDGISYAVRYVGCLDVNASMKSLDFEKRSLVAKECINRVCEAGGLKTADKKRKVEKKIARLLAEKPRMEYAGANVNLIISCSSITLSIMESGEVIANHEMPNVSFASGGDPETLDFVAYVAKDGSDARACYVLECGGGLAQDVITTIGQAFELRFKEYLKRAPRSQKETCNRAKLDLSLRVDPEYYNDLPGKIPPESIPPVPPLPDYQTDHRTKAEGVSNHFEKVSSACCQGSVDNLIDLSSEPSSPNPLMVKAEHEYVNGCIADRNCLDRRDVSIARDPFDMQPFENSLPLEPPPLTLPRPNQDTGGSRHQPKKLNLVQLTKEDWFHGAISRKDAEALLLQDGDFLVRESQGSAGQFVLSGMHRSTKKHLLLVDPEGVVRTKDRVFESVSHLVNYHKNNGLPIISAESALVLQNPILKRRSPVR